jgi:hypothetical protein
MNAFSIPLDEAERQERLAARSLQWTSENRGSIAACGPCAVRRRVSDVEPVPISWLWPSRIAIGKVTMIAGDPGLGKSQLTAYLAARVTTGGLWPNTDGRAPHGSVLMLSCEDDIGDTIRPRLEAAGADITVVHVIEAMRSEEGGLRGFSLTADLAQIEKALGEIGDVRLLTIDPITAYLGGTDTHRTSDVRAALSPLQEMASRRGVAVVVVSHLNKGGGDKAMNRVTGSLAFVAAARAAFLVTKDADDENRRIFVESKNNLGSAPALAFRVEARTIGCGIEAPFVSFEAGTVDITADDAVSATGNDPDERSATDEACEFLLDVLAEGPLAAKEVFRRGSDAGISSRTLKRAKKDAGVQTLKQGMGGGWLWFLPGHTPVETPKGAKNTEGGQAPDLGTLREVWPPSGDAATSTDFVEVEF